MYKFKLIKKINPQDKSAPKKWYAVPISESPQSFRETARRATQNTTISAMELETAIDLLGSYAIEITFKSEGVENIDDFSTSSMIKEVRVIFTPSKEFRDAVTNNIVFGNAGVLEDDINYASLADYRRAKEQSGGGGGTPGEV